MYRASTPRASSFHACAFTLTLFCAMQLIDAEAQAKQIDEVNFPDTIRLTPDGPALVLNGVGLRRILWARVYVIGLYLPARRSSTEEVVALKGPKRMLLVIERKEISARQFIDHLQKRIGDPRQATEMAALKARIGELYRVIEAEGTIRRGETIALDYLPGTGTLIRVNDRVKGKPIAGEEFYQALLRIWIGEGAPDTSLREAMLGSG